MLTPFAPLFDPPTWRKVPHLLNGVILAPGMRMVSAALYVLGLQAESDFARYHPVLSRAVWSSLAISEVLLGLTDAARVWSLSLLTVLAPSRRYHAVPCRGHKTISDGARQGLCIVRRWLPDWDLVVVGDRTYARSSCWRPARA